MHYDVLNPKRKPACISYRFTCLVKIFMLHKFNTLRQSGTFNPFINAFVSTFIIFSPPFNTFPLLLSSASQSPFKAFPSPFNASLSTLDASPSPLPSPHSKTPTHHPLNPALYAFPSSFYASWSPFNDT